MFGDEEAESWEFRWKICWSTHVSKQRWQFLANTEAFYEPPAAAHRPPDTPVPRHPTVNCTCTRKQTKTIDHRLTDGAQSSDTGIFWNCVGSRKIPAMNFSMFSCHAGNILSLRKTLPSWNKIIPVVTVKPIMVTTQHPTLILQLLQSVNHIVTYCNPCHLKMSIAMSQLDAKPDMCKPPTLWNPCYHFWLYADKTHASIAMVCLFR